MKKNIGDNKPNIKEITNALFELNWKIYLLIMKKKPIAINRVNNKIKIFFDS
jgi:hypothetical protein